MKKKLDHIADEITKAFKIPTLFEYLLMFSLFMTLIYMFNDELRQNMISVVSDDLEGAGLLALLGTIFYFGILLHVCKEIYYLIIKITKRKDVKQDD